MQLFCLFYVFQHQFKCFSPEKSAGGYYHICLTLLPSSILAADSLTNWGHTGLARDISSFFYYGGDGMSSREWQTVMVVWQLCSELCRRITAGWSDLRASSESCSQSVVSQFSHASNGDHTELALYYIVLYCIIALYYINCVAVQSVAFRLTFTL